MLGNPLVRFREGQGGNLWEYPAYSTYQQNAAKPRKPAQTGWSEMF